MNDGAWEHSVDRARLLARIQKRFHVCTENYQIGARSFSFTRVVDPDVVLDEVVAAEDRREKLTGKRHSNDELHLPYWAELWDSAIGIAHFLVASTSGSGQTALDLGCGMGFAGMAAAAVGYEVLAGDLEADALLFARLNIGCATRRLNWQSDMLGRRFDLIIGADVLYDKTQWPFLEPFWRIHLKAGGFVLLGEPGRQTGEMFVEWIGGRGWFMRRGEQKISGREKTIRLIRLSRE